MDHAPVALSTEIRGYAGSLASIAYERGEVTSLQLVQARPAQDPSNGATSQ